MLSKFKELIKNNEHFTIALISTTLLAFIIVIFIFSNTRTNQNIKYFNTIAKQINKINSSLESCSADLTINNNESINILTNNAESLKQLTLKIEEIDSSSKEREILKNNLLNATSNTISLYNLCIRILDNPNDLTSGEKLTEFISTKEKCIESYDELNQKNIKIYFSDASLKFFDNIYDYINTVIKVNRDTEIKKSQNKDVLLILNSFLPILDEITQDLIPAIEKVREDDRDLQVILDDIKFKEENLNILKNTLYSSSVPDGYISFYNSLEDFIKIYDVYINSLTDAILYEKSCPDKLKYSKKIDDFYNNSISKYEDVIDSYTKFKKLISSF